MLGTLDFPRLDRFALLGGALPDRVDFRAARAAMFKPDGT